MVFGLSKRERQLRQEVLSGLAEHERGYIQNENQKFLRFEADLSKVEEDLHQAESAEHTVVKLRRLLHRAQGTKVRFLQKDLKLRRRYKVDLNGRHASDNERKRYRKERRFAYKRNRLIRKQATKMRKLNAELLKLKRFTQMLSEDERQVYDDYMSFIHELTGEERVVEQAERMAV